MHRHKHWTQVARMRPSRRPLKFEFACDRGECGNDSDYFRHVKCTYVTQTFRVPKFSATQIFRVPKLSACQISEIWPYASRARKRVVRKVKFICLWFWSSTCCGAIEPWRNTHGKSTCRNSFSIETKLDTNVHLYQGVSKQLGYLVQLFSFSLKKLSRKISSKSRKWAKFEGIGLFFPNLKSSKFFLLHLLTHRLSLFHVYRRFTDGQ